MEKIKRVRQRGEDGRYVCAGKSGRGGHGRGSAGARKGVQGFVQRGVVLIEPDGSVGARWASVSAAARALGRSLTAVSASCQGRSLCCNRKLMYEDEYVKWGDYRYRPHRFRDAIGRFVEGHHNHYRFTAEGLAHKKALCSIRAKAQAADPECRWGKGGKGRRVMCMDTGVEYNSIKEAAESVGIKVGTLYSALFQRCRAGGWTFKRL